MKLLSRTFLGKDSHITYPHSNAFTFDGSTLVYAQREAGNRWLFQRNLLTEEITRLPNVGSDIDSGTYDIARYAQKIAVIVRNAAWILDLEHPREWACVYEASAPATIDPLCSISSNGTKLLCREVSGDSHRAIEIDLKTGSHRELFVKTWHANHFHYCGYDSEWIAFAHEGPAEVIADRCWAWHAKKAPQGKVAFDQLSEGPGKMLYVGHERWGAHDISAYVIAYAVSPSERRGMYEIFADDRPARLLWENDVLWHCNMDPTGRFAIADTTGPFRAGKLEPEVFRECTNRHLETDRNQGQNTSEIVLMDLQTRETLHLATALRTQHPYHPHPAISPDRKWVIWNDATPENRGAWLGEISVS